MEIFAELTLIVILATVLAIYMRVLKQPLITGYILAGILAGPTVFNIMHAQEHIELFSKIGITVLLFIVGLNLSPKVIKEVGKVSLFTGIGQVVITTFIGFVISLTLGLERVASLYVAIALTFSSTIIILKLLSDKGDLHKLYGKIAIGFLLVQDIIATIVLLFVSTTSNSNTTDYTSFVLSLLLKGFIIMIALFATSNYILPKASKFLASSQELLFLFSIAWGLGLALLFYVAGFSVEIGALIAGVLLSTTPFAFEIGSRLKPLRDFFIVLFFVLLGSQMVLGDLIKLFVPALILSLFVFIGNPIIVIVLINLLGYKKKVGFYAGLAVAQVSEFSLILATIGFNLGHISREVLSLITLVGLITITASTYIILYADKLYLKFGHLLKYLELRKTLNKNSATDSETHDILFFGYDRAGQDFIKAIKKLGKPFLAVDYNPDAIQKLKEENVPYRFGDASDVEFLEELNLNQVKLVISTIPDFNTNLMLTKKVKEINPRTIIIVLTYDAEEAKALYEKGATYVVIPHYLGAQHTANIISRLGLDASAFKEEREKHIDHLNKKYLQD